MEQNNQPLVGEVVSQNPPSSYTGSPIARPRYHAFTLLLVGVNIAVYVAMVLGGVSAFSPTVQNLQHWGAMYGPAFAAGQRWRLVTSAFVHIGLIHIAFNMWCLWYLAELSETIFGGWTTVAIYILTAMTSALLSVMWHPMVTSAGASGAIFGLAGAIIIALRIGNHHVPQLVRRGISNSAFRFALYNLI
ncbi:MAG: rhomboid family intramembrane serine protease, partial [Acidobacteriaceae bacterium]